MGTLTATDVATRARTILQDAAGVRWTDAEILRWVNDGQREIVTLVPSAYSKTVIVTLAAGTRQTAATLTPALADCVQLVRMTRNYDAAGTTPGDAITPCQREFLDREIPDWHQTTPASSVRHYMPDPQDPKGLAIYPPVTAGRKAEVFYYALPADVAAIGSAITLDDIYLNPLAYYVLFRTLSKRTKSNTNAKSEAGGYYNIMANLLGVKLKNQVAGGGA